MTKTRAIVFLLCAGCPEIERLTYRFDLAEGRGTLVLEGIGTDEPEAVVRDFALLVNDYLLGPRLAMEHVGWRVGERELYEHEGRLDGRVAFAFSRPIDAGLYQHDKKSPYLWCAPEGQTVVETSGTVVPPYPHCVVFDRKSEVATVTTTTIGEGDVPVSLLPMYLRWDGRPLGSNASLAAALPDVPLPESWRALGLPIASAKLIRADERTLQATQLGSMLDVLEAYVAALGLKGFAVVARGDDAITVEREGARLVIAGTQAGASVLVSVSAP